MVCEYGMSRLGPLTFGKKEEQIFLGREIAQHRDFSEETARQIDLEVRRLIDEAYQSAHTIVETNADAMHRIAAALLERETIDAEELKMLIEGKALPQMRSALASPGDSDGTLAAGSQTREPRRSGQRPAGGFAFAGVREQGTREQGNKKAKGLLFGAALFAPARTKTVSHRSLFALPTPVPCEP